MCWYCQHVFLGISNPLYFCCFFSSQLFLFQTLNNAACSLSRCQALLSPDSAHLFIARLIAFHHNVSPKQT